MYHHPSYLGPRDGATRKFEHRIPSFHRSDLDPCLGGRICPHKHVRTSSSKQEAPTFQGPLYRPLNAFTQMRARLREEQVQGVGGIADMQAQPHQKHPSHDRSAPAHPRSSRGRPSCCQCASCRLGFYNRQLSDNYHYFNIQSKSATPKEHVQGMPGIEHLPPQASLEHVQGMREIADMRA